MADNYLERRMEELRSGKLSKAPATRRVVASPFAGMRVLVIVEDWAQASILVTKLRESDAKTAFIATDRRQGTQLAQSTGSRYYPADALDAEAIARASDDIRRHWNGLDLLLKA